MKKQKTEIRPKQNEIDRLQTAIHKKHERVEELLRHNAMMSKTTQGAIGYLLAHEVPMGVIEASGLPLVAMGYQDRVEALGA